MSLNNLQKSLMGKVAMLVCVLLFVFMSGCATSRYGKQTVKPNYYQDCYTPIAQIRKDADAKAKIAAGTGVVTGLGAAIACYQEHGTKGAILCGLGGAVAGALVAYLITDDIQNKAQDERFAAYSLALDQDISNMNNAVAAARLTAKCYENAYKSLDKAYQAGQISREEMVARLTEIRDGANDVNTILAKFKEDIGENQIVYNDIHKRETQRASGGISKEQKRAIQKKQEQLSRADSDAQKEIEAMQALNKRCSSQLETITALIAPNSRFAAADNFASVCPAAGSEF